MTQCGFYPTAKRLESYQEAVSEDEDCTDTVSGSPSNVAKPGAPGCRTVINRPLGRRLSKHLSGSVSAVGNGDGAAEGLHSRQAAFSSPIVSVRMAGSSQVHKDEGSTASDGARDCDT